MIFREEVGLALTHFPPLHVYDSDYAAKVLLRAPRIRSDRWAFANHR